MVPHRSSADSPGIYDGHNHLHRCAAELRKVDASSSLDCFSACRGLGWAKYSYLIGSFFQWLFSRFSKVFMEGDSTTDSGRLLYISTTLFKKMCF